MEIMDINVFSLLTVNINPLKTEGKKLRQNSGAQGHSCGSTLRVKPSSFFFFFFGSSIFVTLELMYKSFKLASHERVSPLSVFL